MPSCANCARSLVYLLRSSDALILILCTSLGLSPISFLGHLRDDPFISTPPHSFPGLGVPQDHESSRRATPALPPGLSIPVQSTLPIEGTGQVVPSIGTSPMTDSPVRVNANTRKDNKHEQAAGEVAPAEATTQTVAVDPINVPSIEPSFADRSAFPALPKLGTPLGALDSKPLRADSRKTKSAAQATSTDADAIAVTAGGAQQSVLDATRTKRQHLGKLDISAATTDIVPPATEFHGTPVSDLPPRSTLEVLTANSQPTTPATSLETPVKRATQPRTLRVLPTPLVEAPPANLQVSSRAAPLTIKDKDKDKDHPRLSSYALPGTPTSDRISDNMSMTTESISRAGSPLPTRVGSAPVRTKTKSQQKKERQEKAKATVEDKVDVDDDDTAVQEPIMGRKKKNKKEKHTGTSTPADSRPPSPRVQPVQLAAKQPELVEVSSGSAKPLKATLEESFTDKIPQVSHPSVPAASTTSAASTTAVAAMKPAAVVTSSSTKPKVQPVSSPTQPETSGILNAATTEFFKAAMGLAYRADITASDLANISPLTPLTPAEVAQLESGEAVRRGGIDGRNASRVLITESRRLLGGLSRDMEERYIELEKRVMGSRPPLKYTSTKAEGVLKSADEILKDVAAALVRPTTTNPAAAAAGAAASGTARQAKLHAYADDALAYLNQFILPAIAGNGNCGKDNVDSPAIASAIPRTYTTGDPTYSVSGVDVGSAGNGASNRAEIMNSIGADLVARGQALMTAIGGLRTEDAEAAMLASRRESESLEKKLLALTKRNKRLATGNGAH